MIRLSLLALPALLLGCTDPGFTGVPDVRVATAAEVVGCTYVKNIRSTPGVYGPLAERGLEYSRNQTLASARRDGANTVVFEEGAPGDDAYEVRAVAYRC